ncbi:hypothetical protein H70357_16855 [Paenibacillus sp. FSL H7-0357]|uniref:DUF3977 family protein n=1 Tax=unclassified Paenibacillus TaxID=185978 RepID=UPI0004F78B48|nr:DUF3977 family protein [Paenibacillus sp. FSL H7-0357]AIQ18165.1 hypothetical protein H70357_16855 [Paenibacillus sp. FSL H7-0357]
MKYIEFGIGNRWIVRTETEFEDGTETEQQGIIRPIHFHSLYLRIWIGKTVFVADLKEGCKKSRKSRSKIKIVIGISSY